MTKEEQMFAFIEEAQRSKDSIRAFCAARNLNMKTFFYWRRKFLASRSAKPAAFIPLIAQPPANDAIVRLSYPNGVSIHLVAADLSLIAQLIRLA